MQKLPLQMGLFPLHTPPQLIVPPQTLVMEPQLAPAGQVLLVQQAPSPSLHTCPPGQHVGETPLVGQVRRGAGH